MYILFYNLTFCILVIIIYCDNILNLFVIIKKILDMLLSVTNNNYIILIIYSNNALKYKKF